MTESTNDWVVSYLDETWQPIPVPFGKKIPTLACWQHLRLTHETVVDHFNGVPSNVGILNGAPSGVVEVDLDSSEAVAVAPFLLPTTHRVSGREQRPRSHYWYRVSDPPAKATDQFRDPLRPKGSEGWLFAELRSTGSQTLVEPSVHPDGDRYCWDERGEPATATAGALLAATRHVAAASLLARYWPSAGSHARHEAAMAMSGYLLNCGVISGAVPVIIGAAATVAGDEEASDRRRAAADTVKAHAEGKAHTGGTTAAPLFPEGVLKQLASWLAPRMRLDDEPSDRKAQDDPPADAPAVEPHTLAEVVAVFRRWMYLEDDGLLYAVLGAVAANYADGDPVWLMIVGASSGGKTETINAITGLPHVHAAATITESALLSGTPRKERDNRATGGLLREVGEFGILAAKDFTSVLSMNRDARGALLAALREVFDGYWLRRLGVDGGRVLEWSGKLGLIAGCTAVIDSHHAVMATMGERFLLYRLPAVDGTKQARKALANTGREKEMRRELREAVTGLVAVADLTGAHPAISEAETDQLVALAALAARCRSAVERDGRTREVELIHDAEAPARIAGALRRLYSGMIAIGLDRAGAWKVIVKVGFDCLPKIRRGVFEVIARHDDWVSTVAIATCVGYPTNTARRGLEELTAHGVAERQPNKGRNGDGWRLTAWARARYADACVPDLSGNTGTDQPDSPSKEGKSTYNNFSGTQADGERKAVCWRCRAALSSEGDDLCSACGWIRCLCGACEQGCAGGEPVEADEPRCSFCGADLPEGESACFQCNERPCRACGESTGSALKPFCLRCSMFNEG